MNCPLMNLWGYDWCDEIIALQYLNNCTVAHCKWLNYCLFGRKDIYLHVLCRKIESARVNFGWWLSPTYYASRTGMNSHDCKGMGVLACDFSWRCLGLVLVAMIISDGLSGIIFVNFKYVVSECIKSIDKLHLAVLCDDNCCPFTSI